MTILIKGVKNHVHWFFVIGSISRRTGSCANEEGVPQGRLRVHPSPGHRHHCAERFPHQTVQSSCSMFPARYFHSFHGCHLYENEAFMVQQGMCLSVIILIIPFAFLFLAFDFAATQWLKWATV